MAQEESHDLANGEPAEILAVIREECTPIISPQHGGTPKKSSERIKESCTNCRCLEKTSRMDKNVEIELLLKQKENLLKAQHRQQLEIEISLLRERADFILLNEQIRVSCMLQEAHRERQEKISALQSQLECKNMAAVMFVMCTERRRSKLEKLRLIKEYTDYINQLKKILIEAQSLILHLSRGYKTAARVDDEWRQKMTIILKQFQMFIHDYVQGTPETEQYFFNAPALLSTKAPIVDDPNEDPCDCESGEQSEAEVVAEEDQTKEKPWYERLEGENRPFIVFGDMAEMAPRERRQVLKSQKAAKTAPAKWKEYAFNDMFIKEKCENLDAIKDDYLKKMPSPVTSWECRYTGNSTRQNSGAHSSRRPTAASIENRNGGGMGSILKIISTTVNAQSQSKALLLGARDSMEIASATKLDQLESNIFQTKEKMTKSVHVKRSYERQKSKKKPNSKQNMKPKAVINVGSRRTSLFDQSSPYAVEEGETLADHAPPKISSKELEDDTTEEGTSNMSKDSISIANKHKPDHYINFEKVCPVERCKRMHMDAFTRSLPEYMRSNPYKHFQHSYEGYETCTPEQIAILKTRIERSKSKIEDEIIEEEHPLDEWSPSIQGVSVQTSEALMQLPPCTCPGNLPTPKNSAMVFDLADLLPMKKALARIHEKCFYDGNIEFDRFQVIGENSDRKPLRTKQNGVNTSDRLREFKKILKRHPSLLELFQANAA